MLYVDNLLNNHLISPDRLATLHFISGLNKIGFVEVLPAIPYHFYSHLKSFDSLAISHCDAYLLNTETKATTTKNWHWTFFRL